MAYRRSVQDQSEEDEEADYQEAIELLDQTIADLDHSPGQTPQLLPVERGRVRNMVRMFENQSQPTPSVPRPQPLQRIPSPSPPEVRNIVNRKVRRTMERGDRKIRKSDARRADTGRDTRLRHQMNAARVAVETPEALDAVNDMVTRVDHIFNPPEEEIKDIVNGMIDKIEQEQSAGGRPQDTADIQEIKNLLDQLIEDTEQILSQTPPSAPVSRGRVRDLVSRFEIPDLAAFDFLDDLEDEPLEEYDDSNVESRPMPVQEYIHPKRRAQSSPYIGWQLPSHGPIPLGYGRDSDSSEDEDFGLIQMYEPDRHIGKQEEGYYPGPMPDQPLEDIEPEPVPAPAALSEEEDLAEAYRKGRLEPGRECIICLETGGDAFTPCACPPGQSWFHYQCLADYIVQCQDMRCKTCSRQYTDPKGRIQREVVRSNMSRYIEVAHQYGGYLFLLLILMTIPLYLLVYSTLHPELLTEEQMIYSLFLLGFLFLIIGLLFGLILTRMYRLFRDLPPTYNLRITFSQWPERGVYPNNTRVETFHFDHTTGGPNIGLIEEDIV